MSKIGIKTATGTRKTECQLCGSLVAQNQVETFKDYPLCKDCHKAASFGYSTFRYDIATKVFNTRITTKLEFIKLRLEGRVQAIEELQAENLAYLCKDSLNHRLSAFKDALDIVNLELED
jgi:hypothetical protein